MQHLHVIEVFVLAVCAAGAIFDLRSTRIPNALTFGAAAAALALRGAMGLESFAIALLVMTVVAAAGLFLFSFKLIGGGDVKLIAAIAGAFSFPDVVPFVLYTMLGGGVLSLAYALSRGSLRQTVQNTYAVAHPLLYRQLPVGMPATTSKMPYGLAILAGAALVVLSRTYAPFLSLPI
ncbi:MAG: prepilin peptidase [Candidatus Eremiobacteraeota bacterium]|nr:prepilin peptidase [Candidatus Eremiobacteraeota bacterium]